MTSISSPTLWRSIDWGQSSALPSHVVLSRDSLLPFTLSIPPPVQPSSYWVEPITILKAPNPTGQPARSEEEATHLRNQLRNRLSRPALVLAAVLVGILPTVEDKLARGAQGAPTTITTPPLLSLVRTLQVRVPLRALPMSCSNRLWRPIWRPRPRLSGSET